ncbi:hypothetical protein Tco_1341147 [Tanacetum coccineum]
MNASIVWMLAGATNGFLVVSTVSYLQAIVQIQESKNTPATPQIVASPELDLYCEQVELLESRVEPCRILYDDIK